MPLTCRRAFATLVLVGVVAGCAARPGPTGQRAPSTPPSSAAATLNLAPIAEMSTVRAVHSATLLADGRVVVAGGADRAEVLDPAAGRVEPVSGTLGSARLFLTATAIGGDRVLLLGGYDDRIQPTAQAWIVD